MIVWFNRVLLVIGSFPFISLNILCYSLLACKVSAEESAYRLIGVPLYITSLLFPVLVLRFFCIFNFCHLMSWCRPVWIHLVWDFLCFLDLYVCFLSQVGAFFSYHFFKKGLCLFSLSSPSETSIM